MFQRYSHSRQMTPVTFNSLLGATKVLIEDFKLVCLVVLGPHFGGFRSNVITVNICLDCYGDIRWLDGIDLDLLGDIYLINRTRFIYFKKNHWGLFSR
jgi:hypothetical protein